MSAVYVEYLQVSGGVLPAQAVSFPAASSVAVASPTFLDRAVTSALETAPAACWNFANDA
jgi:hypothetical protein